MVKPAPEPRPEGAPAAATVSMTGFAAGQGSGAGHDWSWDLRSVNGKGFDLRLRLPDIEGLEPALRKAVGERVARGNVTLNLKLTQAVGSAAMRIEPEVLNAALAAVDKVERAAERKGVALAPLKPSDLMAMRGVIDHSGSTIEDPAALLAALMESFAPVLESFVAMRREEGARTGALLASRIDEIAALTDEAEIAAAARAPKAAETLRAALARVMEATEADPDRVAQELALIAIKADVTEEIERLRVHVEAARALLAETGPVGRKFEFLAQEFVREANTLCSKSGDAELTRIGLALKYAIDQLREQIQNVE
ncbi:MULTISPECIES: YicC/YloC family endoribonuclease [Thioclava]|nr:MULTISPECIES: YicC/YloC family endoribonuclease [Thioclava]